MPQKLLAPTWPQKAGLKSVRRYASIAVIETLMAKPISIALMNIELRRTTEDDLPYVLAAESDEDNQRFITPWPEEQHRAALDDKNIEHLILEAKPDGQRIGFVILAGLQGPHRSIEFMRIVVTDKGKGYGRAGVRAIRRHAFETLDAHRLWLDVKEHNQRARTLYEREGFRYEGTLRECLRSSEGFQSLVVMSMLEQEYRSLTMVL